MPFQQADQMSADLGELLRATSRTFALGIELLRSPMRDEIRVAYLILRVSDYLEDNRVMADAEKIELLNTWHAVLHGEVELAQLMTRLGEREDPIPDLEAIRHADAILDGFHALSDHAQQVLAKHAGDSTLGMARWVERGPGSTSRRTWTTTCTRWLAGLATY